MKPLRIPYRLTAFALLTFALFLTQIPFTHAAGVVNTCDEASLDAALAGGGVVTFACSGTITLTSTKIIASDTMIDGAGQSVTISGGGSVQIFQVSDVVNFNVNNLTLSNGFTTQSGGAIYQSGTGSGAVNIMNSTFTNNGALGGGAVYVSTNNGLTVTNSTFVNNSATYTGGAINAPFVIITSSTFSNNSAGIEGGAVYVLFLADMTGNTFVNNLAANGAALILAIDPPTTYMGLANNRFLNNNCDGVITDNGGNRVNNAPGCPGEFSNFSDLGIATPPPPPQCQEMLDPAFAAPVGTYCQALMRNGAWVGYPGTIPAELVAAGVIMAMEIIHYDLPGHAAQTFPEDGYHQVCLQGEGRFIYLDATLSPRPIVELNTVHEGGYTCAWIPHPGTVVLIDN